MKPRVALLTNIPTPYRLSFFRELHGHVDLHVVFDDMSEPNRQWKMAEGDMDFPHEFSRGIRLRHVRRRADLAMRDDRYVHLKVDVLAKLFRLKPAVVVTGEFGARTAQAMLYGWLTRTPVIIWSEVTAHTEAKTTFFKTLLRRALAKGAARLWSNGHESTTQLCSYGAQSASIDPGMTGVDTDLFAEATRQWLPERDRLRSEYGLWGPTFLFVGQFIERKGLHLYLDALDDLAQTHPQGWSAVFVGSGPLEPALQAWKLRHPDVPVVLTGFLPSHELPRYFAMADVFVLPTLEDNWSLSALEAAVSGLPQIFSRYNGCSADLLEGGEAGCLVDPMRVPEFASALRRYVSHPPARLSESFADQFRTVYGPPRVASRAYHSIQAALADKAPAMTQEARS